MSDADSLQAVSPQAPLTLRELAGLDRERCPLTRGVPFPPGAVHRTEDLRLTTASGEQIPTQLKPLAHWPDGSLKWVLADWQSDLVAGESLDLILGPGEGPTPIPTSQILVEEEDDSIRVCTGRLRLTLRRDRVGVCEDVELGHRSQNVFVPTTRFGATGLELWARVCEGESFGGTRRRIYGPDGRCSAHLAPDAWSVEVEEAGPLRVVITCRGALELDTPMHHYAGYRPLQFVLRLHFYAGQPYIRCLYSTVMTLNARETQIEQIGLRWSIPESASLHCRTSGESVSLEAGDRLELHHVDDEVAHLTHQTSAGRQSEDKQQPEPWLLAEGASGGVGVAMRHMAKEFPKALHVSPDTGIEALPYCPAEDERMQLSRYAEDVAWHEGEGIYSDGTGTAKTTELFVTYYDSGQGDHARASLQGLLTPPHVSVSPSQMAGCRATGGFEVAGDRFPRSDALLQGVVDWLQRQIQLGRWYGFFNHGDFLIAWEEAAQTWRYHGRWGWCNSEWDPRHGVWIQYLRTGDADLFYLGEAMTRHSVDVDTCHWHPFRPYFVGGCYRHSVDHFSDEPVASHTFLDNWIDHYYLTGDLRTLEVLCEAGDFFLRYRWTEDARFSFSLRSIANTLRGLLYVFEATGEQRYMDRAVEVFEAIARGQNEDGSWHKRFQISTPDRLPSQLPFGMATEGTTFAVELGAPAFTDEEHLALSGDKKPIRREVPIEDQKGYQTHYLLIGIELFHRMTGRQDAARVYRRAVDWFCGGDPGQGSEFARQQHYGGILCRHLAYNWRLTGDVRYLQIGQDVLETVVQMQDTSDDPMRRGALAMSPMYVSLVFFGVPYLLEALREAELDEPSG
ncbi:MAG TPA: hypothetical protein QF604_17390 [Candidatus Latescibacteria bacterium]|nr:hypothetical protein [Gemmatimonadota bacterium]MDP7363911.1 hypothetical protein [Candidatus Latescibacterota bacterium]HJN29679.1 hypothetical protein [Candidatus Latescibacterota bacterium]